MCKRKILQAIFATSFGLSLACSFMAGPQSQLTEQPSILATAGPIFTSPPVSTSTLTPYETSTPQPTLVFPPGMPTPQSVATSLPRAETFGDAKLSDATGKVTFEDSLAFKRLNVQVQDDVKNQPLEQIHVQYISDGNEFLIVALDPTGHYFPAIQSGTLSSLGTAPRDRNDIVSFGVPVVEAAPPLQGWGTVNIALEMVKLYGMGKTVEDIFGLLLDLPSLSSWTSSSRTYCLTGEQASNALGLLMSAGEGVILLPISGAAVLAGPDKLLLALMAAGTFHTVDLDVETYFLKHPGPHCITFYRFPSPFTFLAVEYLGGGKIAFTYEGSLWIMNADDGERTRITENIGAWSRPSWSPDGKKIAFTAKESIYVADVDRRGVIRLEGRPGCQAADPSWSPDGKRIAYYFQCGSTSSSPSGVAIMDANGKHLGDLAEGASFPAWSPDGTRIAIEGRPPGTEDSGLYILDTSGNILSRAADMGLYPDWSPDGSKIVHAKASVPTVITVVDLAGGSKLELSIRGSAPSWSPDGQRIAFYTDHIFTMNLDGSSDMQDLGPGYAPAWWP